ncbi:hypothetical protein Pa4123_14860 [Phytohabitans aurantiacus]|uniref:Uncharacterized protein n=1 Tax=Phytohabitans aurantiacus TaxID=3016789 RepID=A0ABQ5QP44_9ACTN|nr:hypothetical protein Pa4123_14860 [Phytohabitans aurantiacus]
MYRRLVGMPDGYAMPVRDRLGLEPGLEDHDVDLRRADRWSLWHRGQCHNQGKPGSYHRPHPPIGSSYKG